MYLVEVVLADVPLLGGFVVGKRLVGSSLFYSVAYTHKCNLDPMLLDLFCLEN